MVSIYMELFVVIVVIVIVICIVVVIMVEQFALVMIQCLTFNLNTNGQTTNGQTFGGYTYKETMSHDSSRNRLYILLLL